VDRIGDTARAVFGAIRDVSCRLVEEVVHHIPFLSDPIGLVLNCFLGGEASLNFVGNPFQVPCFSHAFRSSEYSALHDRLVAMHS
jgi:hypothetical protein